MTDRPALKRFSGLMNDLGARLTLWEPGRAVIEIDVGPIHLNGIDVVHGAVFGALIDTAGAHSGIHCTVPGNVRHALTVSYTVNLMGNLSSGRLIADARVRGGGKTIFMSSCDIHDGDGNLLATGEVVCRYGRGSHAPEGVPAPA